MHITFLTYDGLVYEAEPNEAVSVKTLTGVEMKKARDVRAGDFIEASYSRWPCVTEAVTLPRPQWFYEKRRKVHPLTEADARALNYSLVDAFKLGHVAAAIRRAERPRPNGQRERVEIDLGKAWKWDPAAFAERLLHAVESHGEKRDAWGKALRVIEDTLTPPGAILPGPPAEEVLRLALGARWSGGVEFLVLADALEESGYDELWLRHCRKPGKHYGGCWVLRHLLGETK